MTEIVYMDQIGASLGISTHFDMDFHFMRGT